MARHRSDAGRRRRPRGSGPRGFALAEALVALLLAAVAAGGLAAAAATAAGHVRLARMRALALALALERLEALRAGPRGPGDDAPTVGAVSFVRTWTHVAGRGLGDGLGVRVAFGSRAVELSTEAWP